MNTRLTGLLVILMTLAACGDSTPPAETAADDAPTGTADAPAGEGFEVVPGLQATIVKKGYGRAAVAGDLAEVHYTGWLFDPDAEDNRGKKFDSSVDRGQTFSFPLGAGRVIRGWDQGVQGMLIGEQRVLTIAPEMAYGDRGAGALIPPGATLVFDVELIGLQGPGDNP
jgi:FKBP-type peptidyl-prolyl cis-trans isomerase